MASRSGAADHRPLAALGRLLAMKKVHLPAVRLPEPPAMPLTPEAEKALFDAAMADVIPLAGRRGTATGKPVPHDSAGDHHDPDAEVLQRLKRLVENGSGFVLSHTAEYVEGAYGDVPPELLRRLHGGYFSVQDHVDLHGMDVMTARTAFDRFLKRSLASGLRAVLVVHGRGRSSPGPPVLKRSVLEWLTRGTWKRWVIAFTSARACDGGTGATYVLLRRSAR